MELTGKCLEDAQNHPAKKLYYDWNEFIQLPESFQQTRIIDFFDLSGIYIDVEVITDKSAGYVRGFESEVIFIWKGDLMRNNSDCLKNDIYETRSEAISKAIIKANEIYNQI